MTALILIHSWLRWGLLALGLLAMLRVTGAASREEGERPADRGIAATFLGLMDLQWLLGVILFVALHLGRSSPVVWIHASLMTLSVVAAHVLRARLRRAAPARRRTLSLWFYGVPMLIILLGHLVLPAR